MSSGYLVTLALLSICIIGISILIYRAKSKSKTLHPAPSNQLKYYKCPGRDINQATKTGLATAGFVKGMDPASSELYIPCSYNYVEQELAKLNPGAVVRYIYAIKGCDQLCSKNDLWLALKTHYGSELASTIMPLTWVLNDPAEYKEFQRYYLQNKEAMPTFILKKNIQGKRGLYITRDISEISKLRTSDDFKVVQRYVDNPYTIRGYKLNIRLYVVIICHKGMVDWYLYNRGKCIYTNKKYDPEISLLGSNLADKEQHFTSYNLDTSEKYIQLGLPESLDDLANWMGNPAFDSVPFALNSRPFCSGTTDIVPACRSASGSRTGSLFACRQAGKKKREVGLEFSGTPVSTVWSRIQARLGQVKECYAGKLCMQDTLDEQVCFQLFGLDFILREQKPVSKADPIIELEPLLLEFNKGPEMIYKSPGDKALKTGLISNMLDMVLKRRGVTESGFTVID
jgi:hypothetical protein